MREENIKKHKLKTFYKYSEVRQGDKIEFGWDHSDSKEVNEPVIVSSSSRSKNLSVQEKDWSKIPASASSVEDMLKFVDGLIQTYLNGEFKDCQQLWDRYKHDSEGWEKYADDKDLSYYNRNIIFKTILLAKGKIRNFSLAGRVYKVVE